MKKKTDLEDKINKLIKDFLHKFPEEFTSYRGTPEGEALTQQLNYNAMFKNGEKGEWLRKTFKYLLLHQQQTWYQKGYDDGWKKDKESLYGITHIYKRF